MEGRREKEGMKGEEGTRRRCADMYTAEGATERGRRRRPNEKGKKVEVQETLR